MKIRTLILLLAAGTVTIGQTLPVKPIDTNKPKVVVIKPELKLADTLKLNLSSTPSPVPIESNKSTQIVIVKDGADGADWAKYLLPIATLFLGICLNRFIDWNNERKKIIKAGQRWVIELRSTEFSITKQIEVLKKFKAELAKQNWENPELSLMTSINGDIFKSLDKNELYKYIKYNKVPAWYTFPFFRAAKTKEKEDAEVVVLSNTVQGHITILTHQYEMMQQKWNDFQAGISKHSTQLTFDLQEMNKQMTLIHIALDRKGINIDNDENLKKLFDLYTKILDKLRNDNTYNPLSLVDDLLNPMIVLINPLRADEIFTGLALSITSLFNDINGVKVEMEYMTTNIDTLVARYEKQIINLPTIVNRINGNE